MKNASLMIRQLLRHSFLAQVRSPFWERGLIVNILIGLLALYLLLNFLAAGYFLDVILGEAFSGQDIIEVANGFLLYTLLAGLITRFLAQSFPVLHIRPYLLLPLRRSRLYHYVLIRSIFNVVNLMPLVVALPFAFKAVYKQLGSAGGTAWLATVLALSLFNHYLAFYLKRQFNLRPLAIIGLLLLLGGLIAIDLQGFLPLSELFGQGISAITAHPALALLPFALPAIAYRLLYRALHYYTYLDTVEEKKSRVESSDGIAALRRLGAAGHFLQLELQQIWRNKRPKTMLLTGAILLLYPFFSLDYIAEGGTGMALFFCILATAFPMANYGQFLIAWESQYFKLLMARNAPIDHYLKSKYYLFAFFNIITAAVCLLYGLADWRFIPIVLASFLINLGINAYLVLFIATYNTKAVDPQKSAFMNWEGIGASQFILVIPTLLGPPLLYGFLSLFLPWLTALSVLAALGLLGLLLFRPMMNGVKKQFEQRKHLLIKSYQQ